jgi:hypothetical protein
MCIKINKIGKQEVGIWWVQKRFPRYRGTYMKLVTKYQISAINSCWEKLPHIVGSVFGLIRFQLPVCRFCWFLYTFNIHLYMHIFRRIFLSNYWWKNATKNEHICSMCIKINKVGKQEVGIWWVQKCFPR